MLKSSVKQLFWTGGIDSTYRLCELARNEETVRPVYIVFDKRPETQREIDSQNKIINIINSNKDTKANILPVLRISEKDIPKDKNIMDLEDDLSEYGLGWQYLYLAIYAKWNPNIEIGQENFNNLFYKKLGHELKVADINGHIQIEKECLPSPINSIFENFDFPIWGKTRKEMINNLKKWGYIDVLSHIWFCYESVDGKPCGVCDNCRGKFESGLSFLFTPEAVHNYYVYLFLDSVFPPISLSFFKDYISKPFEISADNRKQWYYSRFKKICSLSNKTLKKMIVNGCLDYGCSLNRIEKIKTWVYDNERKKKYKEIFDNIEKNRRLSL